MYIQINISTYFMYIHVNPIYVRLRKAIYLPYITIELFPNDVYYMQPAKISGHVA